MARQTSDATTENDRCGDRLVTFIAQAPDGVGIITGDIETDRVAAVRRQIPVLANRRPEAYRLQ